MIVNCPHNDNASLMTKWMVRIEIKESPQPKQQHEID